MESFDSEILTATGYTYSTVRYLQCWYIIYDFATLSLASLEADNLNVHDYSMAYVMSEPKNKWKKVWGGNLNRFPWDEQMDASVTFTHLVGVKITTKSMPSLELFNRRIFLRPSF